MPEEQVVEQPQVIPETPPAEGAEQSLLGRFNSPEELAKSYQELEKKFTQTSQQNAEYARLQQENQVRQMFTPPTPAPPKPEENMNEMFWQNPAEVLQKLTERVIDSRLDFVYDQNYEAQKAQYANDPQFKQYEQQIDMVVKQQYPELRKQPGVVSQLYKMVRGLSFDEDSFKRQVIEDYERSKLAGANSGIEGASPPSSAQVRQPINLSDDEKRVALQFYPDIKPDEAYQRYAASKSKMRGV